MLPLFTLGGLALRSSVRPEAGALASVHELAILARVAAAGERGLTRAKLVGCFWPERDERHARHSFSQALHQLRQQLAVDELLVGTEMLHLNPAVVTSDVGDLQAALARRDADTAVALYTGPFLDGVFLNRADEFERWAESERQRLSSAFVRCLREAATSAAAAGDGVGAAAWWRRAAAADPLDSELALGLVRALAELGDRAGALREARLHETLVRTELREEPDARLAALVRRLNQAEHPESTTVTAGSGLTREARVHHGEHAQTVEELCARGRQCIQRMDAPSFAEGIRYLERAVQLDPRDAGARAALGTLYIVQSRADCTGDPRSKGIAHCERAAELDPTLADAPLWLGVARMLDGRHPEAERLALRGLALDAGGHFSHFVLGWVRVAHGLRACEWAKCIEGAVALRRALELEPRAPYTLMLLASLAVTAGQYDEASRLLERAVEVERAPANDTRLIGAMTLLGHVRLRQGLQGDARAWLDRALADYGAAPQLFTPYVVALTLAALGDLERLAGSYDEALAHYVRAREGLEPTPALIGCGYLVVRLEWRLAGACHQLRMRPEEARHAAAARAMAAARTPYSFNWCWLVSEAEMHHDRAVYHATCADRHAMLQDLRRAVACGWKETALVRLEPAFELIRDDPALKPLLDEALRAVPPPE